MRLPSLALSVSLCLSACLAASEPQDGPPTYYQDIRQIPDAVPKVEPKSRLGNKPVYKVHGRYYATLLTSKNYRAQGIASWYGSKFHRHRTSSGEIYDLYGMTAAHRTLPLPTYVRVTNLQNRRQVIVKVNDRGPFHANRLIDLSYAAAKKLGITAKGTGLVEIVALDPHDTLQTAASRRSANQIYLQVGAFYKAFNANQLAKQLLREMPYPIKLIPSQIRDIPILRVQIGPLPSIRVHDQIRDRLAQLGYPHPITVAD